MTCARDFGIDQMNTMSDPYRETQGYGAKIIYQANGVPYCEKHPLEGDDALEGLDELPRADPLRGSFTRRAAVTRRRLLQCAEPSRN